MSVREQLLNPRPAVKPLPEGRNEIPAMGEHPIAQVSSWLDIAKSVF